LIELLVVVSIIGILASIAIPLFLNQRERAHQSAIQARLKDASTAMEAHAVTSLGTFEDLDGEPASALEAEGFKNPEWASAPGYITIEANENRYCIQARHFELSPSNEWRRATYDSQVGKPQAIPDVCPDL
jgi:type IV pilus assembly protein PilA